MIRHQIITLLENDGVAYRIHRHEPIRSVQDVVDNLPFFVDKLIKTVAFRLKNGGYVLAAVRGEDSVHYPKLAAVFDVNRRALRSLSPQTVEETLGFELGGVGPFPVHEDATAVFDNNLRQLNTVYCGFGRNTETLEIHIDDLITVTGGLVHDITR